MSLHSETGGYGVYDSFVEIKDHSYRSVVRFYENNYKQIQQLPLEEYLDLFTEYLLSLFELAHYKKYLSECQELIELSIEHNIYIYKGEDLLQSTLLRKAACHYHIYETIEAKRVAKELLKINPEDKSAKMLYERCLLRKNKAYINFSRSACIILMLSSAMIISIELLLVRPFYDSYTYLVEFIRNIFFASALLILVSSESYNLVTTRLKLYKLLREIKKRKTV